jgi:hypothetical protein
MDRTGDRYVKWSKPGSERQKFSHIWKIVPKDKCIHKYKDDYVLWNVCNSGPVWGD